MNKNIGDLIDTIRPKLVEWRRHLHAHPELSFEEHETSQFVIDRLSALDGIEISHPSGTSVVGHLKGGLPGPTIAIRADMDALPITEQTNLPYGSKNPGVMHACGHDGHTAILLGTATVLSELRDELAGEIRFLFENGEESPPGGAVGMVAGGAMRGVDLVIGLHLWSQHEIGTLRVNSHHVLAACDLFEIEVIGKGGHIGSPHETIDVIPIAAEIVTALQRLVSREVDPVEPAVVSVTKMHAGDAVTAIPSTAKLWGGTNTFSPAVRDLVEKRIGEMARNICAASGAECVYRYSRIYNETSNDADTARIVRNVASRLFGAEKVTDGAPILPGESFSAFTKEAPACFVLVGAGNSAKQITAPHHDALFNFDEDALEIGLKLFVHSAIELLKETKTWGQP